MYNSKDLTFDQELTFLSYKQPVNMEFTVDEILDGGLWSVSAVNDNVYRCVPLFNCDRLVSSNTNDIILEDNKCLILTVDDDTLVTALSDDVGSTHYYSLQLYAFAPYTTLDVPELSIYCIIYDEFLNTLNNVTVNVLVDGYVTGQVRTDNQGLCKYTVTEACEVSFEYSENVSNLIQIGGEQFYGFFQYW